MNNHETDSEDRFYEFVGFHLNAAGFKADSESMMGMKRLIHEVMLSSTLTNTFAGLNKLAVRATVGVTPIDVANGLCALHDSGLLEASHALDYREFVLIDGATLELPLEPSMADERYQRKMAAIRAGLNRAVISGRSDLVNLIDLKELIDDHKKISLNP